MSEEYIFADLEYSSAVIYWREAMLNTDIILKEFFEIIKDVCDNCIAGEFCDSLRAFSENLATQTADTLTNLGISFEQRMIGNISDLDAVDEYVYNYGGSVTFNNGDVYVGSQKYSNIPKAPISGV